MNVDSAVRTIADVLTTPDGDGVRLAELSARSGGDHPEAAVSVAFPFEAGVDAGAVTVTGAEYVDGEITVDIEVSLDSDGPGADSVVEDASDEAETQAAEPATGTASDDAPDDDADTGTDTATDDGRPAYKDPDRLREVYAECNSFTEMKEALGVDVTAQTVRRNMMKEGIHTPDTTDDEDSGTDSAAGAESESAPAAESDSESVDRNPEADVTDGSSEESGADGEFADAEFSDVDLPGDITPADIRDAVAESSSLHGVQMALDIDIAEARSLLQELGVLEYVSGRIANRDVDPTPVEIEERIQDSLRARADGSGDGS